MRRICERAILIIALVLPAGAQSRNIDPARKTTYHERSSMALDHRRPDVPAPKPHSAGRSLPQQLNQLETQMARGSVTKPRKSSAVNAPPPSRAASLPSERNKAIRAHYQAPKRGTATPKAH